MAIWVVDEQGSGAEVINNQEHELITEEISDETIIDHFDRIIKPVFKNQGWTISTVTKVQRSTWLKEKNFRGSYSYRGLKAYENNVTNEELAAPLTNAKGKKTVIFAGEATHDRYYATVHGAMETGWRAVATVLQAEL